MNLQSRVRKAWRAIQKQSVSSISLALSLGMFALDYANPTQVPVGDLSTLGGTTGTVSLSLFAFVLALFGLTTLTLNKMRKR